MRDKTKWERYNEVGEVKQSGRGETKDKTIEKPHFRRNPPGFQGNWRNPSHL